MDMPAPAPNLWTYTAEFHRVLHELEETIEDPDEIVRTMVKKGFTHCPYSSSCICNFQTKLKEEVERQKGVQSPPI